MDLKVLYNVLSAAVNEAAEICVKKQNDAKFEYKDIEGMPHDNDKIRACRNIISEIDKIVQEIILNSILPLDDITNLIEVDAEEETDILKMFRKKEADYCLVIDPINGTYDYVSGGTDYNICIGVFHKGVSLITIIDFPAHKNRYCKFLSDVYVIKNEKRYDICDFYDNLCNSKLPKLIIKNSRVSTDVVCSLKALGYVLVDDQSDGIDATKAMLKALSGEAYAYVAYTRNMRDVLLGTFFQHVLNGNAYNWEGIPLKWPNGGRIENVLFTVYPVEKSVIKCLEKQE